MKRIEEDRREWQRMLSKVAGDFGLRFVNQRGIALYSDNKYGESGCEPWQRKTQ